MAKSVRRCTPSHARKDIWLVLVGHDCVEHEVECLLPDENFIRRLLRLGPDVPILVGVR